jgi:YggT family protein
MNPIFQLIYVILDVYSLFVIIYVIMDLLIIFDVINKYNKFVSVVYRFTRDLVEPVLRKIRQYVKPIGTVDLSALILLLAIYFIQYTMIYYLR